MKARTTSSSRRSSPSSCETALEQLIERKVKHLLWLAEAIVGNRREAENCVAVGILHADRSALLVPDWRDLWITQCVVCEALERRSAEIKRIEANYLRIVTCMEIPYRVAWSSQFLQALSATTISNTLNAFERAAFILHAHLGFSKEDCASLIGCQWSSIERACLNAISRMLHAVIHCEVNAAGPDLPGAVA